MASELAYVSPPCKRLAGHILSDTRTHCVVCGWAPKAIPHPDAGPAKKSRKRPKGFNGAGARMAATRRLVARDGSWCRYCTIFLVEETTTIDHVIPLAAGGPHHDDNFALCCVPCNRAKGEMSEEEYRSTQFLYDRQRMVAAMRAREIRAQEQVDSFGDNEDLTVLAD